MTNFQHSVVLRDIPPKSMLTQKKPSALETLEHDIYAMYDTAKDSKDGSFYCTINEFNMTNSTEINIFCPVINTNERIDEETYLYTVAQRAKSIAVIHHGDYKNLKSSFLTLQSYAEENGIKTKSPYRVIYHTEKRKWQRNRFFKRSISGAIFEVQMLIDVNPYETS